MPRRSRGCSHLRRAATGTPPLPFDDDGRRLRLLDTRPGAREHSWTASELEAEVVRLCDSGQSASALSQALSARGVEASGPELERAVEALCAARVVLRLNGKLLGLAVNARPDG